MTSTPHSALAALPAEIRSIIFEHVFDAQHVRLKRTKTRGAENLGNLSILATAKFFHKDPVIRAALYQNAILVLRNEADWITLMRLCFKDGTLNSLKLTKRMIWKVPGESVHAKRSFCQAVTQERLAKILLNLTTFEVQLNYNQRVQGTVRLLVGQQDTSWIGTIDQDIAARTLNSGPNRRNEQYEVIWAAVQEVLDSSPQLDVTLRLPIKFNHEGPGPSYGSSSALIVVSPRCPASEPD